MEKPFYVYTHSRVSDGRVFYVGKGKGDRAWDTFGRSNWWKRAVTKHGFSYNIVAHFNSESCAFSFERALIKYYGRDNLCNMTDGGDGSSGHRHTDDAKRRIGEKSKLKVITEETKEKLRQANLGKVYSMETRAKKRSAMIALDRFGEKNPNYKCTKYTFTHKGGAIMECTPLELARHIGKQTTHVHRLAYGKAKIAYGWTVNMTVDPMERGGE